MGRRVAVIGAGPGGLAAALLLARAGVRTVVLEKAAAVGGRTRTLATPQGYRFDLGPTFFLYPRVLQRDLRRLRRSGSRTMSSSGGSTRSTGSSSRAAASWRRRPTRSASRPRSPGLSPADARGVRPFLDENRRKLAAFRPVLERPFDRLADYLAPGFLKAFPLLRPHLTVERDLRRYFADPRVRLAFSFQTKYLGMSPFRCPSLFTILSFLEHEHGIFHPMGGCGAVSEAMARLARRMGVEIRLNTPAERVEMENGRATAVMVAGERLAVDAVVINGDFAHAVPKLVPEAARRRWPDRKIAGARLSCSTFMLYLGLEGGVGPLAHHTILLARDYERNIREIQTGILPEEPSLYVQHAGATDPSMAPAGHTSLYVLVPVPNLRADIDWASTAPRYRDLVLEAARAPGPARDRAPHPLRARADADRLAGRARRRRGRHLQPRRTICGRCSISVRTTASHPVSISSAAAPTRAAACR